MSYSLSIGSVSKADLPEQLATRIGAAVASAPAEHQAEVAEHLGAAQAALSDLVPVLGVEGDLLSVSISGHANAGHTKSGSWADEALTISVSVHHQSPPA